MSAKLMELFNKARKAAEKLGHARGQHEINDGSDTEIVVRKAEQEEIQARADYEEELAKILPADPKQSLEVIVLADHDYGDMILPSVAELVPGPGMIRSLEDTLLLSRDGQPYRLALAVLPADEEYVSRLDKEGVCTHTRKHTCHHCLVDD